MWGLTTQIINNGEDLPTSRTIYRLPCLIPCHKIPEDALLSQPNELDSFLGCMFRANLPKWSVVGSSARPFV